MPSPEVAELECPVLSIALSPRWLVVRFADEHLVTSWAPVSGGVARTRVVAWHEVHGAELRPPIDASELLAERLAAQGLAGAVGLLTSRRVDRHVAVVRRRGGLAAEVVATVGLGNALRAGDPPGDARAPGEIGTINLLCRVSLPLAPEAALEALTIAAEARTLAVLGAGVPSRRSGLTATGTGTDCIAIAAPAATGGASPARYAGKHTELGHLVGAAVLEAIRQGCDGWLADQHERDEGQR